MRLASAPAVVGLDVGHVLRKAKWFVVCWIVLFWRLGYPSLLDPDEAHYAQLTHEMLRGGNWLVPLLDGHPYIDKPVFFHWLQAISVVVFGESEFAMRVPSALAAISLFATTRWVGIALMGERVGETGALMFATIPITFALGSIGLFDMVFTAFLFGGVGALCVSAVQQRPRLQYVGYALLTLAVMTKGPVALVLVMFFGAIAYACGREARDAISFLAKEVRLQLRVLAYNLGNLWRRLVLPARIDTWSLTSLQQRLVKTGGRLVKHARYYWLLPPERLLTRPRFASMNRRIWALPVPTG